MTGHRPVRARYKEKGFLTEDDVRAFLAEHGASDYLFPFRIEPEGSPVPGPDIVIGPVPWELPGGGAYLGFWFSFGAPHEDSQLAWKPVWRRMEGPVTLDELRDLAKGQK